MRGGNSMAMAPPVSARFDEDDAADDCTSGMLVAVRMRPLTANEKMQGHRPCCRVVGDQVVVIEKFGVPNGHLKSQQSSMKEYAYDIAFPDDAGQDEVYAKTVKDIVPTILNGYHATIFAYGATGAGKTHTMMGSERDGLAEFDDFDEEEVSVDGIIPHALTDIFTIIRHRKEEEAMLNLVQGSTFEWKVLISYLEVYNEQIRDLLQPSAKPLALREDPARGIVHVAGLHHEEAQSVGQVLQLLRRGNRNRKTEPTAANQVSSRSHAVIQVLVRHTTTTMLSEMNPRKSTVEGKLSLIDLAGSERASSTQNRGMRLTEGANINKSLLALANCINSLSTHNQRARSASFDAAEVNRRVSDPRQTRAKVQYRDSKLTHLLKNSLEGECRLVMIANLNPSHTCFDETHNTLKYANRAKNIKIRPKMHVMTAEMTYQQRLEKLEKENLQLRKALAKAQAELESDQAISKRKSGHLRHDISPDTLKKFKNFSWGDATAPTTARQPEVSDADIEAMRKTIRTLHKEKAALTEEVTMLKEENQVLHGRMSKADSFLKTIAEPREDAASPTSIENCARANIEDYAQPAPPAMAAPATFDLPKRMRASQPYFGKPSRSSLQIPRATMRSDQENRASNFGVTPSTSLGSARRVSFFGTGPPSTENRFQSSIPAPAGSRLKRPTQYRKSLGGRI